MGRGRRVGMWLVWALVVAVVGAPVYLTGYRYYTRQAGERRLTPVLAELDASDPGWRLDDILAARETRFPPDDENILRIVEQIHPLPLSPSVQFELDNPGWLPAERNRQPDPDILADARAARDASRDAIESARRLRHLARGGIRLAVPANPLEMSLEHTQQVRWVVRLLQLDAVVSACDGDLRGVGPTLDAGLAATRGLTDEPTLLANLVRWGLTAGVADSAERAIGLGEPSVGLPELQQAFAAEGETDTAAGMWRSERALLDRFFEAVDTGGLNLPKFAPGGVKLGDAEARFGTWWYRRLLPDDRRIGLELFGRLIDISRRPIHERRNLLEPIEPALRESGSTLTGFLFPATKQVGEADARTKARLRSAAVGLACERYRQTHGRWPAALADIPRDILPAVPLDPYNGEPLRYAKTENGVVVYAVGPDLADDGGTLSYDPKPPAKRDVGFRLWDVAHRRAE